MIIGKPEPVPWSQDSIDFFNRADAAIAGLPVSPTQWNLLFPGAPYPGHGKSEQLQAAWSYDMQRDYNKKQPWVLPQIKIANNDLPLAVFLVSLSWMLLVRFGLR